MTLKTTTGQQIIGDTDEGEDKLNLEEIANILADYITYTNLEPPFVLGILGKWGMGKSFFTNLIKM